MNPKAAHRPHPKRLRGLYKLWCKLWEELYAKKDHTKTIPLHRKIGRVSKALHRAVNAASWGDHGQGVFVTKWAKHVGSLETVSGLWLDGLHVVGYFGIRSLISAKEEKAEKKEAAAVCREAYNIARRRAAELIQTANGLPYYPGERGGQFVLLYGRQLVPVSAPGTLKLLGFSREDAMEVLSRCRGSFRMPHPDDLYRPRCDIKRTGWNIHLMPD